MKVLVKVEGVLDMACFEEDTIAYMKLQHITCVNTNPNAKKVAVELDARATGAADTREVDNRKNFRGESEERPGKSRLEFMRGRWFTIFGPGIYNNAVFSLGGVH